MKSRTGASELFTAVIDVTAEHQLRHENEILLESERAKSAQLSAEITKQLAAEERIKALLERLVNVQEAERRRLALNLHDHLGQQLTALRLTLSALRDAKNVPDRTSRFETVERMVAQLDRDVDFLAWELRPAALDDVGLQAALGEFTRQWAAANGVAADYHHTGVDAARLPPEVESHLYRIVQEALNNISKHAQATHVSVLLERKANELTLIVEDDGCGFEVGDELSRLRKGGMGLAGIRERTALVGGESELESTPGEGTTLFIRIPVADGSRPGSPQTPENP
jgi:chemotaxis family two-component system sensor kinase Cph1